MIFNGLLCSFHSFDLTKQYYECIVDIVTSVENLYVLAQMRSCFAQRELGHHGCALCRKVSNQTIIYRLNYVLIKLIKPGFLLCIMEVHSV